MKISIRSQTMLKTGQERLNRLFKGQKKSQTLFAVLAFFCHKKYLNYKNIKKNFFKIKSKSCLALYCSTDLP